MERDAKRVPFYNFVKKIMPPDTPEEVLLEGAQNWKEFMDVAWRIYQRLKREGELGEASAKGRKENERPSGH